MGETTMCSRTVVGKCCSRLGFHVPSRRVGCACEVFPGRVSNKGDWQQQLSWRLILRLTSCWFYDDFGKRLPAGLNSRHSLPVWRTRAGKCEKWDVGEDKHEE